MPRRGFPRFLGCNLARSVRKPTGTSLAALSLGRRAGSAVAGQRDTRLSGGSGIRQSGSGVWCVWATPSSPPPGFICSPHWPRSDPRSLGKSLMPGQGQIAELCRADGGTPSRLDLDRRTDPSQLVSSPCLSLSNADATARPELSVNTSPSSVQRAFSMPAYKAGTKQTKALRGRRKKEVRVEVPSSAHGPTRPALPCPALAEVPPSRRPRPSTPLPRPRPRTPPHVFFGPRAAGLELNSCRVTRVTNRSVDQT